MFVFDNKTSEIRSATMLLRDQTYTPPQVGLEPTAVDGIQRRLAFAFGR
jgi:hypothetical protein